VSNDKNLDDVVRGSWGTQVAREVKKFYPNIEIECWFPEKIEKEKREFNYLNMKMRIFPTTFSPMYALDFSMQMINALKEEINKCKKENTRLIIHIHEYHNLHGLIIAGLFKKQKMIAQHHGGSWPLKHLKQTRKYLLFFPFFLIGQILEKRVLKNIKCFFALSKEEMNYIKKTSPNSKVKFQTMGIEEEYFENISKKLARKKLKLPLNKKIFIFIGRINKEKGIKYLLDSMKKLKDIDLKILGYTQSINYFKEYSKKLKLKNVEFLGGVFGKRKLLYLSAADGLILPSSKEGAPVTIMEAFARNLPVITTNVGGVPLMVKDKKNSLIIKEKNSQDIVRAVNQFVKKPIKNVKKYSDKYKWKNIIKDTIKEYEN
jgi:glycosyltransferase involved in cell wall biosynthesis